MDFRDSSPAVALVREGVQQTGAVVVDDDGLFNVTCALAKDAALFFQAQKYVECLEVLKQLLQKKPGDPKVLHNIALTEYFRDGCSDLRKLLNELYNVKKMRESSEAGSNIGMKTSSESKGTNAMIPQLTSSSEDSVVFPGEFDTSVASLNIAIIWYHFHEYSNALSILEPLYQNIEPIDESIAQHVCLLLLDVGIASQNAAKAADVLSYLEKAFNVSPSLNANQADHASLGQQQSSNLVTKSSAASDVAIADPAARTDISENILSRTLSEETIDYENLLSRLDVGGDNVTRAGGLPTSNNLARPVTDRTISAPIIDLRLMQLYKLRFLLLTRNLKSIKREVKEAMNMARGGDSTAALFLKSEFEYARGNYTKAKKLLVASNSQTDVGLSSLCNNNFGCIYYQLGKFHTATMYITRALSNCSALRKDRPKKLSAVSHDKSLIILYNCGLQYLACGKPFLAAHCFEKASLVFSKRPLLWLRIAECCLLALEKGLLPSHEPSSENSDVKIHVIGRGKWRQLVLEDGAAKIGKMASVGSDKMGKDKPISLSVSLARQSLLNALYLLSPLTSRATDTGLPYLLDDVKSNDAVSANEVKLANGDVKESKGGQIHSDMLKSSLVEFEQIRARENQMIKQALLANLAYVELELENPVKALAAAKSLLELPDCSKLYIFLGHVYASEALCLLNRPKEAAEQLLTYMNGENGFVLPYTEENCEPWKIKRDVESEEKNGNLHTKSSTNSQSPNFPLPEDARGMLFVNFASVCSMQGDMELAHKFAIQSLSAIPRHTKAILTLVYVNLMLGKTDEALNILKKCNHVKILKPGRG